MKKIVPLVKSIDYCDPIHIFNLFHHCAGSVLLDSSFIHEELGRYSYIAINPFTIITHKENKTYINDKLVNDDLFIAIQKYLNTFEIVKHPNLPVFQGGLAGFFGYDLCHKLENIALPNPRISDIPDLTLGLYDLVIGFDHLEKQAWIFSSGFPEINYEKRQKRASERLIWLANLLQEVKELPDDNIKGNTIEKVNANFDKTSYMATAKKVIDYIYEGDIFEANISQRFYGTLPDNFSAFNLYRKLRKINPATFSSYVNAQDIIIASSSPERFIKLEDGHVETRPIKGTRPRANNSEDDKLIAEDLLHSEKDRAENIMIVDLMRNDLARVCEPESIKVKTLCGLETYASVHHLVSVVTGTLVDSYDAIDLLKATFPGGSVTGAPKVRAMQIIYEMEQDRRGPYCGSVGYIGFDGSMDTSILIRTHVIKGNQIYFQVGGAVTAKSDPASEYDETLTKAAALRKALMSEI